MTSHKIAHLLGAVAATAFWLTSCSSPPEAGSRSSNIRGADRSSVREPLEEDEANLDLGDDWIDQLDAGARPGNRGGRTARGTRSSRGTLGEPGHSGARGGEAGRSGASDARGNRRPGSRGAEDPNALDAPRLRSTYWGIVLGTFGHDAHQIAALNMLQSVATFDPRLGDAHIRTTNKGSMVVFGVYEGPDSPVAQKDLKWIKSINVRQQRVFTGAVLTRIRPDRTRGPLKPNELMSARRRFPKVNPLYTLQVAAWGDFDSGTLSLDALHRRTEARARELRAQGYEAYFHHDDDLHLSVVTIGLFDHTAVDGQSGIFAPEVEILLREFPAHLVNGEPLYELKARHRPELGRRVQTPRLMLVPQW